MPSGRNSLSFRPRMRQKSMQIFLDIIITQVNGTKNLIKFLTKTIILERSKESKNLKKKLKKKILKKIIKMIK